MEETRCLWCGRPAIDESRWCSEYCYNRWLAEEGSWEAAEQLQEDEALAKLEKTGLLDGAAQPLYNKTYRIVRGREQPWSEAGIEAYHSAEEDMTQSRDDFE